MASTIDDWEELDGLDVVLPTAPPQPVAPPPAPRPAPKQVSRGKQNKKNEVLERLREQVPDMFAHLSKHVVVCELQEMSKKFKDEDKKFMDTLSNATATDMTYGDGECTAVGAIERTIDGKLRARLGVVQRKIGNGCSRISVKDLETVLEHFGFTFMLQM
jgi:hypothetical protein